MTFCVSIEPAEKNTDERSVRLLATVNRNLKVLLPTLPVFTKVDLAEILLGQQIEKLGKVRKSSELEKSCKSEKSNEQG